MSSIAGAVGSVAGGLIGSHGAKKAAKAQKRAAKDQLALQREQFDYSKQINQPYVDAGANALAAQRYLTGTGPQPTFGGTPGAGFQVEEIPGAAPAPAPYAPPHMNNLRNLDMFPGYSPYGAPAAPAAPAAPSFRVGGRTFASREEAQAYADRRNAANPVGGTPYEFQTDPGYQFRLGQGAAAVDASAAAKGGLNSGATLQALTEYGQEIGSNEFGKIYNRLAGLSGQGQATAGRQAVLGANYAGQGSNALAQIGNARASGFAGQANAFNGALQGLGGAFGQYLGSGGGYGYGGGNGGGNALSRFGNGFGDGFGNEYAGQF